MLDGGALRSLHHSLRAPTYTHTQTLGSRSVTLMCFPTNKRILSQNLIFIFGVTLGIPAEKICLFDREICRQWILFDVWWQKIDMFFSHSSILRAISTINCNKFADIKERISKAPRLLRERFYRVRVYSRCTHGGERSVLFLNAAPRGDD